MVCVSPSQCSPHTGGNLGSEQVLSELLLGDSKTSVTQPLGAAVFWADSPENAPSDCTALLRSQGNPGEQPGFHRPLGPV